MTGPTPPATAPGTDRQVTGRAAPRVLHLGMGWHTGQAGGLNRYVAALRQALTDRGTPARAVVAVGPAPDAPPSVVAVADHTATLRRRISAYRRAAAALAGSTDVVDAHFALLATPTVVTTRLRRLPLVVHFHGPWAAEAAVAGDRRRVRGLLRHRWERVLYRRADAVVVLSSAFAALVTDRYGVDPQRVRVIAPGVDLDRFTPGGGTARRRSGVGADAPLAVCVRRLVPRMGIDVLLQAWTSVPAPARLVIVGDGPERADLEALATRLGIDDRVAFTGRVGDDELVDWYRAADVNCVPSRALEGFGLVVLEALACGTPTLATDVGGLGEAASALGPGFVVPPENPALMGRRLAELLGDASARPDRDTCRRLAERWSWDRCATEHLDLYAAVAR